MIRSILLLVWFAAYPILHAAPEADPAIKLREQLRAALLQLRKTQADLANAQSAQAAAEAKNQQLEEQIAALNQRNELLIKQSNAEKTVSAETIAKLNSKLAEREKRLVAFNDALAKWKFGYQQAAAIARSKEDERAALATESTTLKRTLADREAKNIALFNLANEILDRFENHALGKSLAAREPFIGTARVKVENLVQDYKDRVLENRLGAKP